ncbi:hypothetical protein SGPA1_30946 [Streptomyces misionensis JCM 4497]
MRDRAGRDRQQGARGRGDLDPRRRGAGRRPGLPRDPAGRGTRGRRRHPTDRGALPRPRQAGRGELPAGDRRAAVQLHRPRHRAGHPHRSRRSQSVNGSQGVHRVRQHARYQGRGTADQRQLATEGRAGDLRGNREFPARVLTRAVTSRTAGSRGR